MVKEEDDAYGFVTWLSGIVGLVTYIIWVFVPKRVLEEVLGITYYPSKYWALAVPLYICVSLVAVALLYMFYNMSLVPAREEVISMEDEYGLLRRKETKNAIFDLASDTPIITDMSPEESSHLLYGSHGSKNKSTSCTCKKYIKDIDDVEFNILYK